MIIPVRCQSCGKPIAQHFPEYKKRVTAGEQAKAVLDDLKLTRYCCRVQFLSNVDLLPLVAKFKKI